VQKQKASPIPVVHPHLSDNFLTSFDLLGSAKSPRFVKSHLHFCFLPQQLIDGSTKSKMIYVARNPKDTVFHFSTIGEWLMGTEDQWKNSRWNSSPIMVLVVVWETLIMRIFKIIIWLRMSAWSLYYAVTSLLCSIHLREFWEIRDPTGCLVFEIWRNETS
jgi:hypothetical protein